MASIIITGDGDELAISADAGANTRIDGSDSTDAEPLPLPWMVTQDADGTYTFTTIGTALYATTGQYRDRNPDDQATDELLTELLTSAARYIDRRLGWCVGAFAPITARTLRIWPRHTPTRTLRLRDSEGLAWPLRTWTEINVDYSGRGTPDHTWTPDPDSDWILSLPTNGTIRPIRKLRIWESHRNATESVWPNDPGIVDIAGSWGWDVTPDPIRELSIHVTRQLRDAHLGGAAAMVAVLEGGAKVNDPGAQMWRRVEMEYNAGRMGRLGVVSTGAGRR